MTSAQLIGAAPGPPSRRRPRTVRTRPMRAASPGDQDDAASSGNSLHDPRNWESLGAVTENTLETTPDSEVRALLRVLDGQRRHVLGTLDGLDPEALRRPVLPSGWHCLGMVQHLALDVERFWFRAVVAGNKEIIRGLTSGDEAWNVAPEARTVDVLDGYR